MIQTQKGKRNNAKKGNHNHPNLKNNNHSHNMKNQNPSAWHNSCHLNFQNIPHPNIKKIKPSFHRKMTHPSHQHCPLSQKISTPRLFSRSRSVNRIESSPSSSPVHLRSGSASNKLRQAFIGITRCSETAESSITDHQIKTLLKPLLSLKTIDNKKHLQSTFV